ncbi:phage tail protein [Brevibacillus agri]|uniref:major tail protein n=1 Tax=Brevibacillus TaxID=55080 RepID=UPI000271BB88|nr:MULTISPECIES: major tail protein [Brevibacillus]EJL44027.1 phage major tail protein, phi13 family [Brevibacillus sp. CF112]MBG9567566.1 phage tail protein [Brevibacillus agri]MBG9567591.1 phage tail protein [Brevibacillus agri]MED1642297.1 phage tail protein [Brevibacillus agri]MED1657722.1 phage tail protein [Brevibacillus agri]
MATVESNKIKYGLRNVHYAVVTEGADGTYTYATPKRLPGAVNLSLSPVGEKVEFYADDIAYHVEETNNGYDGELEVANLTDEFRIDVLGEQLVDGVLFESADQKGKKFALLFEFDGDKKAKRHVLYNCTAARPTVAGSTRTNTKEPKTSQLTFSARPRPADMLIKADTAGLEQAKYEAWYTAVYEKAVEQGG